VAKLRALFSNAYMASVAGVTSLRTIGGERVKQQLAWKIWSKHFAQGCVRRIGQDVRLNCSIPLAALLMSALEDEYQLTIKARDNKYRSLVASIGAFSLIAYCGSFQGPEVFLVDLHGLGKFLYEDSHRERDHVIIPLLERFNGELNSRYHLAPIAASAWMDSGLEICMWVERLIKVGEEEGHFRGPAFCNR
jgi:hypothetical protein